MKIFTLGYQGINIHEYITTLLDSEVSVVLDVRETPWSYKKDFSRSKFRQQLEDAKIQYIHVKSAGNPSHNRKTATSVQECLARYKSLLDADHTCIHELIVHLEAFKEQGKNACLTCFEKHFHECHRSILTDYMTLYITDLQVFHLEAKREQLEFQL